MTGPGRHRALLLGAALLVAGGIGAAALLGRAGEGASADPAAAVAAPAGPVGVGALGRVEPASRILRLAHGGLEGARIERMLAAEGERVAEGQVLAEFHDAAEKDAALAQAEASLAQARARLERVRAAGRPSEVAAQRARIAALQAAEEIARRDAIRAETLVPTGAGGAAAAERNRFAAIRTAAERAEAEAALETLLVPRPEDVAEAEASFAAAEAALLRARAEAARTRLRAPIAGTVLKVHVRAGERVGTDGVLELADLDRLDVVADVYETDLPRLRPGATAEVVVPGEARRFAATLREIGWQVRRTSQAGTDPVAAVDARTVEVRLGLEPEGAAALARRSNMQVQVAIRP